MPLLDLDKLTAGLSQIWSTYLRDWDRCLRSANHPETTRYNYLLAAAQLARYLAEHSPDPDAETAAGDPTEVTRAHCEAFQAWMIETRSAATALNKHKGLQQFFRWLRDDETATLLNSCKGKSFVNLRDEALIRLYYNTGGDCPRSPIS